MKSLTQAQHVCDCMGALTAQKNQSYPWLHQKHQDCQAKGSDSPPPLCSCESPAEVLYPSLQSPGQKDIDLLECIQRRACKMTGTKKHLSCEERLRGLGLLHLEKAL